MASANGQAEKRVEYPSAAEVAERLGISVKRAKRVVSAADADPHFQVKKSGPRRGCIVINGNWRRFEAFARDVLSGAIEPPAQPSISAGDVAALLSIDEGKARLVIETARDRFRLAPCEGGGHAVAIDHPGDRDRFLEFARNAVERSALDGRPWLVVDIRRFARACRKSIRAARGVSNPTRNGKYENLMRYDIEVEAEGHAALMRLDIACALAKRIGRLPRDAYGEEIACAMPTVDGSRWVVAYSSGSQLMSDSMDAANIDHLVPRSAGGGSRLCNFHVMRMASNSDKSSVARPDVSGEPQASMRVLSMLRSGVALARSEGRISAGAAARLDALIDDELRACIEMLGTGELVSVAVRAAGARAAGRVASRVAAAARGGFAGLREAASPRRVLVRVATGAVLGRRA